MSEERPLTIKQHLLVRRAIRVVDEEAGRIKRKWGRAIDEDDLMSAGGIALVRCALRFDDTLCPSFEAYARLRVRGAMLDHVRAESREKRIWREMERAGAERMADFSDDYDVLRDTPEEFQRRLDRMCEHQAAAIFLAGARQARKEAVDDPEAAAEYAQTIAALDAVLKALGSDERELVELMFAADFNLEEAAEALGVVRKTAWRRIHRVLEKLRTTLQDYGVNAAPAPINHPRVRPVLVARPPPVACGSPTPVGRQDGDEPADASQQR